MQKKRRRRQDGRRTTQDVGAWATGALLLLNPDAARRRMQDGSQLAATCKEMKRQPSPQSSRRPNHHIVHFRHQDEGTALQAEPDGRSKVFPISPQAIELTVCVDPGRTDASSLILPGLLQMESYNG